MNILAENKNKLFVWLVGFFYVLVFFLLLKNSFSYLDPDFGWHIKMGQEIISNLDVPRTNFINYTIYKVSWVDHEWLSGVLTYFIYDKLGYIAVNIFFAFLALIAFLIQYFTFKKFFSAGTGSFLIFLAIQLLGAYASQPSLGVRMQEFTLLFLAFLLLIFYSYEKKPNKKILLCLPVLFWFWASLHGGFLLGVGLLGFFVLIKLAEIIVFKFFQPKFLIKSPLPFKKIVDFSIFGLLSLAATCLTPYGLKLYSFLTSYRNDYYLGVLSEWLNQFRYPLVYWQLAFLELLLLVFIWWGLKVFWFRKGSDEEKISLWNLFLLSLFTFMAFRSKRHFPLLFMVSVPVLAYFLTTFLNLKNFSLSKKIFTNYLMDKGAKTFFILVFICSLSLQIVSINFVSDPWMVFGGKLPYGAVQYLKHNPEYGDLRLFNEFNWGGYLIWTLPGKQLFIDGRLSQYWYKGRSLLEEYQEFLIPGNAEGKLAEHKIEMVLLESGGKPLVIRPWKRKLFGVKEKEGLRNKNGYSGLETFLKSSPEWRLVYGDGVASIYVKK